MVRKAKLLERARNNVDGLRYGELLALVEEAGFVFLRQHGSHRQYAHPRTGDRLTLQPRDDGKAKAYQVRQFLKWIDAEIQ